MANSARPSRRSSALPRTSEQLAPWLGAALLIGGLNVLVAVLGAEPTPAARAAMILGLSGALVVAGLVAARSTRETRVVDLEERERPAFDELGVADARNADGSSYVEGMSRWVDAMLELTEHAAEASAADELRAAADDTRELRELLRTSTSGPLGVNQTATLHSVCALWEAEQDGIEQLAARVDPRWHRRWKARSVVHRLVRRDVRLLEPALPYRD